MLTGFFKFECLRLICDINEVTMQIKTLSTETLNWSCFSFEHFPVSKQSQNFKNGSSARKWLEQTEFNGDLSVKAVAL